MKKFLLLALILCACKPRDFNSGAEVLDSNSVLTNWTVTIQGTPTSTWGGYYKHDECVREIAKIPGVVMNAQQKVNNDQTNEEILISVKSSSYPLDLEMLSCFRGIRLTKKSNAGTTSDIEMKWAFNRVLKPDEYQKMISELKATALPIKEYEPHPFPKSEGYNQYKILVTTKSLSELEKALSASATSILLTDSSGSWVPKSISSGYPRLISPRPKLSRVAKGAPVVLNWSLSLGQSGRGGSELKSDSQVKGLKLPDPRSLDRAKFYTDDNPPLLILPDETYQLMMEENGPGGQTAVVPMEFRIDNANLLRQYNEAEFKNACETMFNGPDLKLLGAFRDKQYGSSYFWVRSMGLKPALEAAKTIAGYPQGHLTFLNLLE